jgi:hypothetical protein
MVTFLDGQRDRSGGFILDLIRETDLDHQSATDALNRGRNKPVIMLNAILEYFNQLSVFV